MNGVFEKIIEKLEERASFLSDCTKYGNKDAKQQNKSYSTMMMYEVADLVDDLVEIVKQAAAEYNNAIIDGKYCFQTCACTEKCDKCSRLCNGDIDWYENIDNWAEEYNNVWIPCSEPPKDDRYVLLSFDNFSVPMVGRYEEDEKGGSYYIGDEMEPCVTQDIFVNAWQPLPPKYQPKGE